MNPYKKLPKHCFWRVAISGGLEQVRFDAGKKFDFSVDDHFATAGSCFAQHFARMLKEWGGNVLIAEKRHPLIPEDLGHGYGVFSARYGNIYTARHLRELLEQAFDEREVIHEYAQREDGYWVDMLRPRAVPMGFVSEDQARLDRDFHLSRVREMVKRMTVFVFTLGLTESWVNTRAGYCYPIVPGAVAGQFDADSHAFVNFAYPEVINDLTRIVDILTVHNPKIKILLTVSPVALVATAEPRSVLVSTVLSKSVLRAAADALTRMCPQVDYFPSYEIITSPYARGRFWKENLRDVTDEGVANVMSVFFASRFSAERPTTTAQQFSAEEASEIVFARVKAAFDEECDEILLDPQLCSTSSSSDD